MTRTLVGIKAVLLLALALHVHHRFKGPPVDYLGLAAAAAASWAGIPGPGEPVLIAEAVFAAKHDLDIGTVIAVAWLGAAGGGMVGWAVGLKAGRAVLTAPGPLRAARQTAVQRGEEVFARHPVLAIVLTPSWVAGINGTPAAIYTPVNALSAALWATAIGLGAYFVGPPIVEVVDDYGVASVVVLAVLVLAGIAVAIIRRRRKGRVADAL